MSKQKNTIDSCVIGKTLGSGYSGTVFEVTCGDKKFALKINHILKKDIDVSFKSPVWREIDFAKFMGRRYPAHFMQLIKYDIVDMCKHKHKLPKTVPNELRKKLLQTDASPWCSRQLYSLVDTTLVDERQFMTRQQMYSVVTQLLHCIGLMHKHGYTHNDIVQKNIGLIRTKYDAMIDIVGTKMMTRGYRVVLIDYGLVLHKKYTFSTKKNNNEYNMYHESLRNEAKYSLMNVIDDVGNIMEKNMEANFNYKKFIKALTRTKEFKTLATIHKSGYIAQMLMDYLYPMITQPLIFGSKFKKVIRPTIYIDPFDIMLILNYFPMKNDAKYDDIVQYFMMRTNSF